MALTSPVSQELALALQQLSPVRHAVHQHDVAAVRTAVVQVASLLLGEGATSAMLQQEPVLQAAVGTLEAALHRKAEGAKGDGASYPRLLWLLCEHAAEHMLRVGVRAFADEIRGAAQAGGVLRCRRALLALLRRRVLPEATHPQRAT